MLVTTSAVAHTQFCTLESPTHNSQSLPSCSRFVSTFATASIRIQESSFPPQQMAVFLTLLADSSTISPSAQALLIYFSLTQSWR